jgi:hypothetical protein
MTPELRKIALDAFRAYLGAPPLKIGKVDYVQERSAGLTDLLYHFRNKYLIHAVFLRYKIINLKSPFKNDQVDQVCAM